MASKITLEQGRAAYAYKCAQEGVNKNLCKPDEYKSYAKKIPMLIKTNGLGATFAFMESKGGTHKVFINQTQTWLAKNPLFKIGADDELTQQIISMDSAQYRAVSIEVLALFSWIRRFAEGLIKKN